MDCWGKKGMDEPAKANINRVQEIEQYGFTIIEKAIDPQLTETIRAELAPFCQGAHPGRNNFEGHRRIQCKQRFHRNYSWHPSMAGIAQCNRK
jgi:hypothetical protein